MQTPATGKVCSGIPKGLLHFYKSYFSRQHVVELNGYVIILVEGRDGKIKLYGSPAEKDTKDGYLEVADEILDVNERKLEDLSRTEVIRHIHEVSNRRGRMSCGIKFANLLTHILLHPLQCIQSCMIKLRVMKRRSDSRLGNNHIHRAIEKIVLKISPNELQLTYIQFSLVIMILGYRGMPVPTTIYTHRCQKNLLASGTKSFFKLKRKRTEHTYTYDVPV